MDYQREKESRIVGSGITLASNRDQKPRIKNKNEIKFPTLEGTQRGGRKAFLPSIQTGIVYKTPTEKRKEKPALRVRTLLLSKLVIIALMKPV